MAQPCRTDGSISPRLFILTILAVISGIYCCDLPSFINSPLFVNDHNSILYGIGQSIIASYIFFLIQVVIVDKIRLHKCRDAAYYEISGIKSNMESISELLSGERDIKEYEEDKIKDHLKNMNFFQYGSGMDCNLKEMTVIEALIYNLEEIDKKIKNLLVYNLIDENKKSIFRDVSHSKLKMTLTEMKANEPGSIDSMKKGIDGQEKMIDACRSINMDYYIGQIIEEFEEYYGLLLKVRKLIKNMF